MLFTFSDTAKFKPHIKKGVYMINTIREQLAVVQRKLKDNVFFNVGMTSLKTILAVLLVPYVSILAVGGYLASNEVDVNPSIQQRKLISLSMKKICDYMTCTDDTLKSVTFKVRHYAPIADIGKPWDMFLYGVVYEDNGSKDLILSEHLFDDYLALTVFLYHEVNHVIYSNHRLYQGENPSPQTLIKQCEDHNHVKRLTSKFAFQYDVDRLNDAGFVPGGKGAVYYTELPGNLIQDCVNM